MDGYTEDKSGGSSSSTNNTSTSSSSSPSTLVARATSIKIVREQLRQRITSSQHQQQQQQFIAALVPDTMVESSLRRTVYDRKSSIHYRQHHQENKKCIWLEQADRVRLSKDLLPRIHPIFDTNTPPQQHQKNQKQPNNPNPPPSILIRAIFSMTGMAKHAPCTVVLMDVPASSSSSSSSRGGQRQHQQQPFVNNNTIITDPTELLQATNGEGIWEEPNLILKLLIVSQVHISSTPMNLQLTSSDYELEIPLCPVCLHRIDPSRLGLPKPHNHQLCSKFCPVNDHHHHPNTCFAAAAASAASSSADSSAGAAVAVGAGCPKQRFLKAWPEPSHCIACHVIKDYQTVGAATFTPNYSSNNANNMMFSSSLGAANCNLCALQKTLWVCLTCGFCGCGRYSNKHAEQHFLESGHSYSLELATLRIWDYANGGFFSHRGDILECPAGKQQRARALQIQQEIVDSMSTCSLSSAGMNNMMGATAGEGGGIGVASMMPSSSSSAAAAAAAAVAPAWAATTTTTNINNSSSNDRWDQQQPYYWHDNHGGDEKSPKKAIMIGEEYEALLQSALEEQAQHYQGEISRLRAALTAEQVDMDSLTKEEAEVIEKLRSEISGLRQETERVGRDLLDAQAQEAGHRADSQRLLRQQQVAQDLLKTIQEETKREQEDGRRQVEELEQQIADLTANLRMRHQFSQDQELTNAHIFGTMTSPEAATNNGRASTKKGKLRRLFRK